MDLLVDKILGKHPLIIGHRGYAGLAPENTISSFRLAMRTGADLVELDYHHSKDGIPMVFHDRTLDRTSNARLLWKRRRLRLAHKTIDELQQLDAGSWFEAKFSREKIPTLAEALQVICEAGSLAVIEHKSGDAKTLVKILREGDWIDKVVVISFDWKFLHQLHELEPRLMLGALGPPARLSNGHRPLHVRRGLVARLKDLEKTGARLAVWNHGVSKRAVRLAARRDIGVWVYTVDHARLAHRLVRIGVKGIITNEIERVMAALNSETDGTRKVAGQKGAGLRALARKFRRRR